MPLDQGTKMSSRFKSAQRVKVRSFTTKTEFDLPAKNISNTNQQKRIRPKTVPTRPQKEGVKPISLSVTAKIKSGNAGQGNSERRDSRNENVATKLKSLSNSLTEETVNGSKISKEEKPKSSVNTGTLSAPEPIVDFRYPSSSQDISEFDLVRETEIGTTNHVLEHANTESPENDSNSICNEPVTINENENSNVECISEEHFGASVFDGVGRFFMCSVDSDVTTPWIGGLAYVKSGDIICLDLNNECIKRFDKNFKMVSSIEVPFDCCGMTITSPDEIAVTCLNEIHFYNIGKFGMNRTAKYFTVNGMAHGIASNEGWFAVTCDISEPEDSTIRVIDETGSEQFVIYPPVVSELPLKLSSFIELDRSLGRVFISESRPSRVVCVNFHGEALWDISIPGGSRGIVSIGSNILVCEQYSEKVRLLTKDGALKAPVLTSEDGLCNPDIIARRPDSNDVIVSYGGFGTIGLFSIE